MTDLLILGAGLTGLWAGVLAAQKGLRTRIIATGHGALHWTPGTIDVLGYLPGESEPVKRPFEALESLFKRHPQHPYTRMSPSALHAGLVGFQQRITELGLAYDGAMDAAENLLLPSPVGAPRPVFLAPRAQIAGDMRRSEPYLIVGFQPFRDFYPTVIAENLSKLGHRARAAFLPLDIITPRHDVNVVQLARAIDENAVAHRLATELKRLHRPGERVGLPAVLGLERHPEVFQLLEAELGAPLFEIPTLPPSVPGMRLALTLRHYFEKALHGQIDLGMTVTGYQARDGAVAWVWSRASARPVKHRAKAFLLATGGILGGGFHSDHTGRVWETIFDAPLTIPQTRSQWFQPAFLAPEGHPVFSGGLRVDAHFHPVDAQERMLFSNLYAAGNLLADSDGIAERSMEGIAIATATAAINQLPSPR